MNLTGIKTLIIMEVRRSFRVPIQVFGAPLVTALLFFLVFGFSIGDRIGLINGLNYREFIMPGLIMMNVLNTAFMSVSSAFLIAKFMNTLSDILLSPLSENDLILGWSIASVIRSVVTAILIWLVSLFFVPLNVAHFFYLFIFLILVSFIFSLLGLIAGIWADNFEQISLFPTFLITPLSFLGGVFYSVDMLPPNLQVISHFNPFFYLIDGMRFGFYGISDVNPLTSFAVVVFILLVTWLWARHLLKIGYKIRS